MKIARRISRNVAENVGNYLADIYKRPPYIAVCIASSVLVTDL